MIQLFDKCIKKSCIISRMYLVVKLVLTLNSRMINGLSYNLELAIVVDFLGHFAMPHHRC